MAQQKIEKNIKWNELQDPEFFKFDNIGDKIEGKLIEKGTSGNYGFGLYTIKDFLGQPRRFHGTRQLDTLMSQVEVEDIIQVEYIDVSESPKGEMKIFRVRKQ